MPVAARGRNSIGLRRGGRSVQFARKQPVKQLIDEVFSLASTLVVGMCFCCLSHDGKMCLCTPSK